MEEPDNINQYEVRGDDGNIYGPVSNAKIKIWYAENRLNAKSMIRRVGDTDWASVTTFEELNISSSVTKVSLSAPAQIPRVIFWYRIYCSLMGVILGLLVILFLFLWSLPGIEQGMSSSDFKEFKITSMIMIFIGAPCSVFYFVCAFMTHRGWHWILGLVSIGLGMSGCCLPVCIPLLIFWIKPETKFWLSRNE